MYPLCILGVQLSYQSFDGDGIFAKQQRMASGSSDIIHLPLYVSTFRTEISAGYLSFTGSLCITAYFYGMTAENATVRIVYDIPTVTSHIYAL